MPAPVKLYHFPVSAPSRGALLAARLIGVPVEVIILDLMKKEQMSESFIKINPQHCVPTLNDDGFVIWESRAIACYLADKYGKEDALYPKDLQRRAVVNQRLYFDSSFLYPRIRAICNNDSPVEVIILDLMKKEQMSESFIKINPQHCVPTLNDDGFVIWESRAIACYLADKYGKEDALYPKDLQRRAVVNQRLYFDSSFLYPRIRAICYPIIFEGVTEIKDKFKEELNNSLGFLNQFLDGNKWVAGDHVTVADAAILASLTSILEVGWDISQLPNIQRWLKDCASLPGYEENLEGAKSFAAIVKKNLKQ